MSCFDVMESYGIRTRIRGSLCTYRYLFTHVKNLINLHQKISRVMDHSKIMDIVDPVKGLMTAMLPLF